MPQQSTRQPAILPSDRWLKRPASQRQNQDEIIKEQIVNIYNKSRKTYGSPRIHKQLKRGGIHCGKKRVERLMREAGIQAIQKRKFKVTTDSRHNLPVAESILNREFTANNPNKRWVTDITYISTDEGWLYLAAVMDLYSKRIVGYSMQKYVTRELVIEALHMAITNRRPDPGLVIHSDRVSQYASCDYQRLLRQYGFICSMSRKGDCRDDSPMESFFKTLKTELVYNRRFKSRATERSESPPSGGRSTAQFAAARDIPRLKSRLFARDPTPVARNISTGDFDPLWSGVSYLIEQNIFD
ncbi:MAG: IS3 family transposase [Eubacteriales bacterium]|jgi:transposase InsO family protein|nr:IS3 family transposase [Eubacteriales bacterium]